MSMPPPGSPPGGSYEPPGSNPPGYTPPGSTPPGSTPPGSGAGDYAPPGGGYNPPGGNYPGPGAAYGGAVPAGFGSTPGPLAEWPQRALGGLIDYVGPAVVIFFLFAVTQSFTLYFLLGLLNLGWGAYNGYLNGTTGQSIGKKVIGLKVLGEQSGQVIGAGNGILRWAIPAVLGFFTCGLFYLVDLLFPLWDPKKQTLHDKVVKSVVITVPK